MGTYTMRSTLMVPYIFRILQHNAAHIYYQYYYVRSMYANAILSPPRIQIAMKDKLFFINVNSNYNCRGRVCTRELRQYTFQHVQLLYVFVTETIFQPF